MHQGDIYPIPKEKGSLDVELAIGTGNDEYISILAEYLDDVLERARPDIVFYLAGCDVLAGDPLAALGMTEAGLLRRDMMVIDACVDRGLPVAMTLGGGYGRNAWRAQYASIRAIIEKYGRAAGPGNVDPPNRAGQ